MLTALYVQSDNSHPYSEETSRMCNLSGTEPPDGQEGVHSLRYWSVKTHETAWEGREGGGGVTTISNFMMS